MCPNCAHEVPGNREDPPPTMSCDRAVSVLHPLRCGHDLKDEPSMNACAVVCCDRDAVARGLCERCYARYRRAVSPAAPRRSYAVAEYKQRLRAEMTRRREAGESIAGIASAVDVNTSTARKWLREWNVEVGQREDARATKL